MFKMSPVLCCLIVVSLCCAGQGTPKLSPAQMKEDVAFLEGQLFRVHANPFTELSVTQYERLFDSITAQCSDSLSPVAFRKLIQPSLAYLSDEHAHMGMNVSVIAPYFGDRPLFLPFTLIKKNGLYYIDYRIPGYGQTYPAVALTQINGRSVASLIDRCALYTYGFPDQREANALQDFGYLFGWSRTDTVPVCTLRFADGESIVVRGTTFQAWEDDKAARNPDGNLCSDHITYHAYGSTGYIQACSFSVHSDAGMDSLRTKIADIFRQVRTDSVRSLVIDVSHNGGGNSEVGEAIIGYITARPYRDYQCNWKRSDEYLKLMTSWGFHDAVYTNEHPGKVLHLEAGMIAPPHDLADRFKGKVYVLIGSGTFSSAIQFATVVKDNHIAVLAGETPREGHPNHFGELYSVDLPQSGIAVRFGVKEWIRPAGKTAKNILEPDIPVRLGPGYGPEAVIAEVERR